MNMEILGEKKTIASASIEETGREALNTSAIDSPSKSGSGSDSSSGSSSDDSNDSKDSMLEDSEAQSDRSAALPDYDDEEDLGIGSDEEIDQSKEQLISPKKEQRRMTVVEPSRLSNSVKF